MAKLNMKDYENFLKEEARQDRLQAKLERQHEEESHKSYKDWMIWQEEQKTKEFEEEQTPKDNYDDAIFPYDDLF